MAARKPAKKKAKKKAKRRPAAKQATKRGARRSAKPGGQGGGSRAAPRKRTKKKAKKGEKKKQTLPEYLKKYQFQPGESGNPSGRPKGQVSLTHRLKKLMTMPVRVKGVAFNPERLYADLFVELAVVAATTGDFKFFKEVFDRLDGKVPDHVVMEGTKRMVAQEAANLAQDLLGLIEEVATSMLADSIADMFMVTLGRKFEEAFAPKEEGLPEDIVILKTEEAEPPAVQAGEIGV